MKNMPSKTIIRIIRQEAKKKRQEKKKKEDAEREQKERERKQLEKEQRVVIKGVRPQMKTSEKPAKKKVEDKKPKHS